MAAYHQQSSSSYSLHVRFCHGETMYSVLCKLISRTGSPTPVTWLNGRMYCNLPLKVKIKLKKNLWGNFGVLLNLYIFVLPYLLVLVTYSCMVIILASFLEGSNRYSISCKINQF